MARSFAFAFLDCEFGGLDPELHDITEVGVIVTDDRLVEQGEAQWRVAARPERITPESAKMFGYDAELWAVAPGVRQVLSEVAEMLPKDKVVVPAGQNVRMDVLFLERAYKQCEIPYPFDYHVLDLATLYQAWTLVAGKTLGGLSLRQAATSAGLLKEGGVAHRALEDARLTLECYRHYIGRLAPVEPEELEMPDPGADAA